MARIRSVKPEFWADEYLAEHTSRDARMLYVALWNLADEHGRARGGVRYLKGQVFPYDDDLGAADVEKLVLELERAGRVERYTAGGDSYLHLPKLAKHQRLEPAKVASRLPEPPTQNTEDSHPDDNPPESIGENTDESAPRANKSALFMGLGSGVGEPVAGDQNPSSELAPRPDVERLCGLLADLIETNGSKRPRIGENWRKACRLLLDVDERTEQQIENAIRWSQADEFWRSNVLSMPKLREKYDQLRLAAQRANAPPKARPSTTDAAVADTYALAAKYREGAPA